MSFWDYKQRGVVHSTARVIIVVFLILSTLVSSFLFEDFQMIYLIVPFIALGCSIASVICVYYFSGFVLSLGLLILADIFIWYFLYFSSIFNIIYSYAIMYLYKTINTIYPMMCIAMFVLGFFVCYNVWIIYTKLQTSGNDYDKAISDSESYMKLMYNNVVNFLQINFSGIIQGKQTVDIMLQAKFSNEFLNSYVDVNFTMGDLLLIKTSNNRSEDDISSLIFNNLTNITEFYNLIFLPFLLNTVITEYKSLISVGNGLIGKDAMDYLKSLKISSFQDIIDIPVKSCIYEQLIKLPYAFTANKQIIQYVINDAVLQYIKNNSNNATIPNNDITKVSTDTLLTIQNRYSKSNTAPIIKALEILSLQITKQISNPLSLTPIYILANKVFKGRELKMINDDQDIQADFQLTINCLKEYQKIKPSDMRVFYLDLIQQMKNGDDGIKIDSMDLTTDLVLAGYIDYKVSEKITQRKNKIDEIFSLFMVDIRFQSLFNQILTNDALLYGIAQNLQINIDQKEMQRQYSALDKKPTQKNLLKDQVNNIQAILMAKQFNAPELKDAGIDLQKNPKTATKLKDMIDNYNDKNIDPIIKQSIVVQIRNYIKCILFQGRVGAIQNQKNQGILTTGLLYPLYISNSLFKSKISIDNKDINSKNTITQIKFREFILPMAAARPDLSLSALKTQMINDINTQFANTNEIATLMLNAFNHGRAIQYTLNQNTGDFDAVQFKKVYGRYYIVDSNIRVLVNMSAFMNNYSSIQYGFMPLQYDFSKTWAENIKITDNFIAQQIDIYRILTIADAIWYDSFKSSNQENKIDISKFKNQLKADVKIVFSSDLVDRVIDQYEHIYLYLYHMCKSGQVDINNINGSIFGDVAYNIDLSKFTMADIFKYRKDFNNPISKYLPSHNILQANNLFDTFKANPIYFFSKDNKRVIYQNSDNTMTSTIVNFSNYHDINSEV